MDIEQKLKGGFNGPAIATLIAVLILSVALVVMEMRSGSRRVQPSVASQEAKAYASNLKLSEVELKESEAWAGNKVVELAGKMTNAGERPVKRVELTCIFQNIAGQPIGRERLAIVRHALRPGETRPFRLPFEGIAKDWNQALPQLVIADIQFE